MSLFSSSTPLTQAIDHAVAETTSLEDVGAQMEVVDIINETDAGAKDAAKYLRKKLAARQSAGTTLKLLVLVETCVKNCGRRMLVQVATKDFMEAMTGLVVGKSAMTGMLHERTLGIIQSWADGFPREEAFEEVRHAYEQLKRQGVEFPARDVDALLYAQATSPPTRGGAAAPAPPSRTMSDEEYARALDRQFREADARAAATASAPQTAQPAIPARAPAATPARAPVPMYPTTASQTPAARVPTHPGAAPSAGRHVVYQVMQLVPGQRVMATPEQIAKLRGDLDVVQQNTRLLTELSQAVVSGGATGVEDVLPDLASTCRAMQNRVIVLCDQLLNEDLNARLLSVNDQLLAALQLYDRARAALASGTTIPAARAEPQYAAAAASADASASYASAGYYPPVPAAPAAAVGFVPPAFGGAYPAAPAPTAAAAAAGYSASTPVYEELPDFNPRAAAPAQAAPWTANTAQYPHPATRDAAPPALPTRPPPSAPAPAAPAPTAVDLMSFDTPASPEPPMALPVARPVVAVTAAPLSTQSRALPGSLDELDQESTTDDDPFAGFARLRVTQQDAPATRAAGDRAQDYIQPLPRAGSPGTALPLFPSVPRDLPGAAYTPTSAEETRARASATRIGSGAAQAQAKRQMQLETEQESMFGL